MIQNKIGCKIFFSPDKFNFLDVRRMNALIQIGPKFGIHRETLLKQSNKKKRSRFYELSGEYNDL